LGEERSGLAIDSPNGEFEWDSKTQGLLLGSFFIGYTITQVTNTLVP